MPRKADPELVAAIASQLRTLRQRRGWSQEELAERSGIQVETISRCENQRLTPTLPTLEALAQAFEVTVASLLGEGGDRPVLNERELRLLGSWRALSPGAQEALLVFLEESRR